jgi:DNA invertase Pin-like site-specific DNA recombinase
MSQSTPSPASPRRRPQRDRSPRPITRVAGYLRVSSEDQIDNYSLAAQERAICAYCEAHGWDLVALYVDEGKSAWTDDAASRPQFAAMLADAEAGAFDAVVVHKLDRFARSVIVALETLKLLEALGVGFVSITEQMDFTTPIGKVILTTLAAFAEYYSDNLSAETRKGKAERKRQGIYNGLIPFGAAKGEDGIPIPDPHNHPGLVMAFEMAASGATDRDIAQALNDTGYRTTGNRGANPFTKDTVRPMLQNRFYLGELPDGQGGWVAGKHAPMVDEALFDAAAAARFRNTRRRHDPGTPTRSPWALSGVATCGCGATMRASGRADRCRRIECAARRQGLGCDAPSFFADVIEGQLTGVLAKFILPESERGGLVADWVKRQETRQSTTQERARLAQKLERLRTLYLEGDLDDAEYRRQRAEVNEALAAIPPDELPTSEAVGKRLAALLADLGMAWTVATPEERNRIARQLFADVIVENRTAVAVKPRPELAPFFESLAVNPDPEITPKRKRRGSHRHLPPRGCGRRARSWSASPPGRWTRSRAGRRDRRVTLQRTDATATAPAC